MRTSYESFPRGLGERGGRGGVRGCGDDRNCSFAKPLGIQNYAFCLYRWLFLLYYFI